MIRFIDEQAVAYGGPGDRVRLSKPCGSSARDLPAGARHASIETITTAVLKMPHSIGFSGGLMGLGW